MTNKFVAYYRVSTTKQGKSGLGLAAQEQATESYLGKVEGELIGTFTDIESGSKDNRPELQKALRECRLTGAILLIAKLDRLSRNRRFLMELSDSSTDFVCCDMPEANNFTVGLLACLADYERQLISERTKAALQAAKSRGVKLGNPNLHLIRNSDTKAAIKSRADIAQKRNTELRQLISEIQANESGQLSLRQISDYLNRAGYRSARGGKFHANSIRRIMHGSA